MYKVNDLEDPYSYTIEKKIMHSVSRRMELATMLNVTSRHGATQYQTTNYGLSGMVIPHLDSWGYEHGAKLEQSRRTLVRTGDIIATFMGTKLTVCDFVMR